MIPSRGFAYYLVSRSRDNTLFLRNLATMRKKPLTSAALAAFFTPNAGRAMIVPDQAALGAVLDYARSSRRTSHVAQLMRVLASLPMSSRLCVLTESLGTKFSSSPGAELPSVAAWADEFGWDYRADRLACLAEMTRMVLGMDDESDFSRPSLPHAPLYERMVTAESSLISSATDPSFASQCTQFSLASLLTSAGEYLKITDPIGYRHYMMEGTVAEIRYERGHYRVRGNHKFRSGKHLTHINGRIGQIPAAKGPCVRSIHSDTDGSYILDISGAIPDGYYTNTPFLPFFHGRGPSAWLDAPSHAPRYRQVPQPLRQLVGETG